MLSHKSKRSLGVCRALLVFLAIHLVACSARWTKIDTTFAIAAGAATAADWGQSSVATRACLESNTIIGHCGENVGTDLYFTSIIVASSLFLPYLPQWARRTALATVTVVELYTVRNNSVNISDRLH